MQCYRCSQELAAIAKFCPKCGASTTDTPYMPGASLGLESTVSPPAANFAPSVQQSTTGSDTYLLLINGQQSGPYTINQMKAMWQTGTINAGTAYWQAGMAQWQSLANIRHFLDAPSGNQFGNPVIVNQVGYQVGYPAQPVMMAKSRVTFVLLGLFLGCLGIHNFYAGYSGKGVAQLLITIFLGWVFGLGVFITGIWALIEIIAVNTDAQGVRMA